MEDRIIYLTNPANLISFVLFVFGLWVTWSKLNWQIEELKQRVSKIEDLDLDARLTKMQTDIDRIRLTIEKMDKSSKK